MASLACRRLELPTASISCVTRKCHEHDQGSNMTALKHQDSRQPHLLSCFLISGRNGFLGCASGTGGPDLRRSANLVAATTTHDLDASKCAFLDTARILQGSDRLFRAQQNLSAVQMPEVTGRSQTVHGEGASLNKPVTMDSSASTASLLSMSSNSDEEESSGCASSEISSDASCSPRNEGPLDTLRTLCEALPLKRGLSRCFGGKSQSFSSLAEVCSVVDLAKPENPFVKRRRTENPTCYRPRSARAAGIRKQPCKSFHVVSETMSFRRL